MKVDFHPDAEREFIEASRYYETQVPGLGESFIFELEQLKNLLSRYPELGVHIDNNLRRVSFRRFPYSLIYGIEANRVWVVAIAHQHRRPGYWKERSPKGG